MRRIASWLPGLLWVCVALGCGGERRGAPGAAGAAEPDAAGAARSPRAAGDPLLGSLLARCQTDAEACRELSSLGLDAGASKARCERGGGEGCLLLGLAYERGVGVEQSSARAREHFERACQLEHAAACALAAGSHAGDARLTREGASIAMPLWERACEGGAASACAKLGVLYYDGEVVDEDLTSAARFYGRACELRGGAACFDMTAALRYMWDVQRGGKAASPGELHTNMCSLFDVSCREGHDDSCAQLEARCAREAAAASGNRNDFANAQSMCQLRDGRHCARAGALREGSPGVAPSMVEAERLYAIGCEEGEGESCARLAKLYMHGRRVGDPGKLLDEACARALPGACLAKGLGYQSGELGRKDPARAMRSFVRSCAQREPQGCLALARARRDSLDGPASREDVAEAFRLACGFGSLAGCREGARFEPSAWFDQHACFHGEASACAARPGGAARPAVAAGMTITAKPLIEENCLSSCQLGFIGADGHGLLAWSSDKLVELDPRRGVEMASRGSWDVAQLSPRAKRGQRRIWSAAWGWDAAAGGLVGLLRLDRERASDTFGLAIWSARGDATPRLVPYSGDGSLSVVAMSADLRFGVVALWPTPRESDVSREPRRAVVLDLRAPRAIGAPIVGGVTATAFSADGSKVAIGLHDGSVAILATATGAMTKIAAAVARIDARVERSSAVTWSINSLSFHPTRPWLVATDPSFRVRIWQLDGAAPSERSLPPATRASQAAFSADGRYLVLGDDHQLVVHDAVTLHRAAKPAPCNDCFGSSSIAVSSDSRYVAIYHYGGVSVFELATTPVTPATPAPAGGGAR